MSVSSIITDAKNWIDGLSKPDGLHGSWRLLVLEKSNRVAPDGTVKDTPVKIRRFAQGCPWALVHEALKYLSESAPYSGIIYNGLELDGVYRPTRTRWVRDDNVSVDKNRADNTYTLIQDLVDSSVAEAYSVRTGSSCSEEVVTEWNWDSSSIEDVPDSTQGVTYSIQTVSRNEDGSFNYALVKRTALTQHSLPVVTECGEFETVTVETWDNVYGSAPDFTDETGAPIGLPEACDKDDGVVRQVSIQENPDCTFKISVQTRTAKVVESERSTQKTIYESDSSVVSRAEDAKLPDAPPAAGGVIKTHKSELRPDGKFDNTEQTKVETEVLGSTKIVTVSRRGTRVTVVNTNQDSPASTEGLDIGDEVKVEKTPGGKFNNSVSEWDRSAPVRAGEKCSVDQMRHTDERTTAGVEMPPEGSHVSGGGVGGHVKTRTTVVGDDGDVTQTEVDEVEKEVLRQKESWRVGITGVVHSVTDMQTAVPAPAPGFSKGNVGSVVENEKTPGGLVNVTKSELIRSGAPIAAGDGCARTVFEHADTATTNRPDGSFGGHALPAGGGHYYEVSSRLNDDGSSTVVVRDTLEEPVPSASVTVSKTLHGVRTKTVHRNQSSPAPSSGLRVGDSVTNEITKGGLVDQTIETFAKESVGKIGSECRQTALQHDHTVLSNQSDSPGEEITAAVGTVRERVLRMTEFGTWDVTDVTRTAKKAAAEVRTGTPLRKSVRVVTRNSESNASVAPGGVNVETSASTTPNEFGRFDTTVETVTFVSKSESVSGGADRSATILRVSKNDTSSSPGDSPSVNKDVDVSLSLNEHGSYDKTVRITNYLLRSASASGKGADKAKTSIVSSVNDPSPAVSDAPSVNKDVDVSITQNEHGSYDKTVRITNYEMRTGSASGKGADKAKTSITTFSNDPSSVVSESPSQNKDVDVSITQNEHGSYDKTVRVTVYTPRTGSASGKGALKAKTTVTTHNNAVDGTVSDAPSVNKDVDVSISQNEHGSYDKTIRITNYEMRTGSVTSKGAELAKVSVTTTNNDPSGSVAEVPSVNKDVDVSISQNEHGSYDKTVRVTTYSPRTGTLSGKGALKAKTTVTTYNNSTDQAVAEVPALNKDVDVSISQNEHGSYDKTVRVTNYEERIGRASGLGSKLARSIVTVYNNSPTSSVDETPDVNKVVEATVSQNEHGSYDKTIRITEYSSRSGSVSGMGTDKARSTYTSIYGDADSSVSEQPSQNHDVEVTISQNEHGSYDKTIRVVDLSERFGAAAAKGADKAKVTVKSYNWCPSPDIPDSPSVNKDVDVSISQNEHGSYDKTIRITDYQLRTGTASGKGAMKAKTMVTTVNNDTSSAISEAPAINKDVDVSISQNEHGSYDKSIRVTNYEERTGTLSGKGALKAKTTVSTFSNSLTQTVNDSPSVNKDVDVSITQNEHGSYDKSVRVTNYELRTGTASGKGAMKAKTTVTTYNNDTSNAISETPSVNKDVDVSISQNEHGSYDKTVRVTDYEERVGSTQGKGADKARVSTTVYNNSTTNTVSETPSVNKDVDVSITQNEHGSYDKSIRVTEYKLREASANGKGAENAKVDITVRQNDTSASVSETPSVNREVDVSISQNEHGSYDKTIRVTTYTKAGGPVTFSNPLYTETQESYVNDPSKPTGNASVGSTISLSCSPNQHGSFSTTKVTRTGIKRESTVITWSDTYYSHRRKVYRNASAPEAPSGTGGEGDLAGTQASCSFQINEYGLYDGSWETKTALLGSTFLMSRSGTETAVSDSCTYPDSETLRFWKKRETTKLDVRYVATRNPLQIYEALTGGYSYNGRGGRVVGFMGDIAILAVYDKKPGDYRVAFEEEQA